MKRNILLLLFFTFSQLNTSPFNVSLNKYITTVEDEEYRIKIVDENGNPVSNAKLSYAIWDEYGVINKGSIYSNTEAIVIVSLTKLNMEVKNTFLFYEVDIEGYCPKEGRINYDDPKSARSKDEYYFKINIISNDKAKYSFTIKILDRNRNPISDVNFTFEKRSFYDERNETLVTDLNGEFNDYVLICGKKKSSRELEFTIRKDGFYNKEEKIRIKSEEKNYFEFVMNAPNDFLTSSLLESNKYNKLVNSILSFIDLLQLESLLSDSYVEFNSIDLIDFKEKKYLSVAFRSVNEYNSIKLDKYDIAIICFDDIIRKILSSLNDNLGSSKEFYGYELTVKTKSRNFVKEVDLGKELEYKFYIPRKSVVAYKNLDIVGQALVDQSIILFNGERIGLKLQR